MLKTKRLVARDIGSLTDEEREECRLLTFRRDGMMEDALSEAGEGDLALMVRDSRDRLAGWALLWWPNRGDGDPDFASVARAHFFVRRDARRQGIGTRLAEAVARRARAQVESHDRVSECFFKRFPRRLEDCG